MNITNENAVEILNTLIGVSPEFKCIIEQFNAKIESRNARKIELLQADQNLAEDEAKAEQDIKRCKIYIDKFTGLRLTAAKKLKAIKDKREAIHREWIEKYASNNTNI